MRAAAAHAAVASADDAAADDAAEVSWCFAPGAEIVRGISAWALLGDGRRCETWLAWCRRRWAPVAVKLPRPDHISPTSRRALAREARAVAPLAHPSIQRLLETRLADPLPHLVFAYAEGPMLGQLLDDQGPLAPADVIRLGLQLAAALHYLHGCGVVHLDLKPGNVCVCDGRALIMDFDLARRIGSRQRGGTPRGTPPYMAPEQIGLAPAAPSMDLFALGATLYEAVTGRRAFDNADGPEPEYPQLAGPPVPARAIDPRIPVRVDRAIGSLLAAEPAARPASALAALSCLADALPNGEVGLWPAWVGTPAPTPLPPRSAPGAPRRAGGPRPPACCRAGAPPSTCRGSRR